MKTSRHLGYILSLIFILGTGYMAKAQDSEEAQARKKAEQAAEMQAIQKAEQAEKIKARKEMLEIQQEEMREMERHYAEQAREMEARAREAERSSRPFLGSSGVAVDVPSVPSFHMQGNQAQLTLRNSFRGGSDSSKGEFEVESGTRYFRVMINGRVQSGEIYIKVEYPGGKVFKELTINSSAEISFSQSLSIREGEEAKYTGTWKYEIKADKAEGNYMLQISTN